MSRALLLLAFLALAAGACSSSSSVDSGASGSASSGPASDDDASSPSGTTPESTAPSPTAGDFPPAPAVPTGELDEAVIADLDQLFLSLRGDVNVGAIARIGESDDPRVAWLLADVLRFAGPGSGLHTSLVAAFEDVTDTRLEVDRSAWGTTTDYLIAWDLPAPPDYVRWKRQVFELIEPAWQPFFDDEDADIDWRWVSWGGVLIDDRPLDRVTEGCPEGCIPALNDPGLVQANTDDDWLDDERIVFGVEVNGEAVAFPRNIMEIHEMVNMTIGERRIGMPYCTLCGSAQAYFTDIVDTIDGVDLLADQSSLELRTSGLLSRSNKVMYEFHTRSVFDTFTGDAVSGPLQDAGVTLEQISVITTTWGDWKDDHPDSSLIAEDGGIGRTYVEDPLRGRDDNGPIFPIGDVDPRLPVQEPVLGVIAADGTPVAFRVSDLEQAVEAVSFAGITVEADGGGFVAVDDDGTALAAHQAFWFAWSQFHPDTELWLG